MEGLGRILARTGVVVVELAALDELEAMASVEPV